MNDLPLVIDVIDDGHPLTPTVSIAFTDPIFGETPLLIGFAADRDGLRCSSLTDSEGVPVILSLEHLDYLRGVAAAYLAESEKPLT